jgi:hypothetical protein
VASAVTTTALTIVATTKTDRGISRAGGTDALTPSSALASAGNHIIPYTKT